MAKRTDHTETAVIHYLLAEWQKPLRLTTVAQAMAALALPADDERRWSIGQKVRRLWRRSVQDPQRYERWRITLRLDIDQARIKHFVQQTREWGTASYILDEGEKLVARYILLTQEREGRLPSLEQIARAMGESIEPVRTQCAMLARIGFLAPEESSPTGYRLAPGYRRLLRGLGFSFHTVTLASGERFNVPCAIDYLLMVSRLYPEETVTVDNSCAHCVERIHVVITRGLVIEATPEEPLVYRGGT